MSTPNLHYTKYNSHMPMTKKLPNDTIQLLCKFMNVNNLLDTHANVMEQIDNSSCGVFTNHMQYTLRLYLILKNLNML
jgi:hypothetical protein